MAKTGMTIIEQYDGITGELRDALFAAAQPEAVDWTKVKGLLGQFVQSFGPLLLQLLVSMLLTPASETK